MNELNSYGVLEENVSLKKYNTYKIDSTAKYVFHPKNIDGILSFLSLAKEKNIPYFILGNGSNVILSDGFYEGVILKLDLFDDVSYNDTFVTVGAGKMINALAFEILNHGLQGLEWASGIPGTIGGCIFGNAGAYKISTFDYLKTVTYISETGKIVTKRKEEITHGYRTSFFKETGNTIILSAVFEFPKGNKEKSMEIIKNRFEKRKSSQPLDLPSAGSTFRNYAPDLPTWKFISALNLKGKQIGGARVSDKHANFIVNVGGATGKDIRDLIKLIKEEVQKEYQIDLILEQELKDW